MQQSQVVSDAERLSAGLGQLPEPEVQPAFIVVSGLPGTGKSYFSSRLVERQPFLVLESDALRQNLFPRPTYSQEESSRLFRACHYLIERLLNRGVPIILDATNLAERHRERLYRIAESLGVKLILVWVEAPPEVVRERIRTRQGHPDNKSDADWSVFQKMQPQVERIKRHHYTVDTSRDINPALNKIIREIRR